MNMAFDIFVETPYAIRGQLRLGEASKPLAPGENPTIVGEFNAHIGDQGAAALLVIDPTHIQGEAASALIGQLDGAFHQRTGKHILACDVVTILQSAPESTESQPAPAGFNISRPFATQGSMRLLLRESPGQDQKPSDKGDACWFDIFDHPDGSTRIHMIAFDPRFMSEAAATNLFRWLLQQVEGISRGQELKVDLRFGVYRGTASRNPEQGAA